jgi:CcmD family protein
MSRFRSICAVALALLVCGSAFEAIPVTSAIAADRLQPPQQQEEFVPLDELPPDEQLPAAPMVVAAYAFIWVAFLAYVFTLIRRVRSVEAELRRLEQGQRQ